MSELTPSSRRALFSSFLRTIDGLCSLLIVIEFQLFRDWRPIFLQFIGISVVLFLLVWVVPRSPAFYASKGHFRQARQIYKGIAKLTGSPMFDQTF